MQRSTLADDRRKRFRSIYNYTSKSDFMSFSKYNQGCCNNYDSMQHMLEINSFSKIYRGIPGVVIK